MSMKKTEGNLDATNLKFGIVISRFNEFISSKLLSGAIDALIRHGAKDGDIETIWVPGAFEIPMIAKKLAEVGSYDAIICLGTIIRGDTPHFDFVAAESAKGIAQISLSANIPISFGILTTNDVEQAIERAGLKSGNRGFDAAVTSIEMANLMKHLN
ncbi:MAG: 6,7-dimethyl-8-ribityllumazine synthase [Bacteroidetes bacterium]|nr:6,7-dimethyl-8-ribityllumazine synthase [Bacteroidota bacterium]